MDATELFVPAIEEMSARGVNLFGPLPFQEYCKSLGLAPGRTAARISIDTLDKLDRQLRAHQCMVLRLGKRVGGKTDFALLCVPEFGPECFFLMDEVVFGSTEVRSFVPEGTIRDLLPFHLLNQLTERSATLLALGTGLLERALALEGSPAPPVSDSGVYEFDFTPHSGFPTLRHNRGQVEVDALFIARRAGSDSIFVVEAKLGSRLSSVAKHKLAYPIYGMLEKVPPDIAVVPIYLRIVRERGSLVYQVAECEPVTSDEPLTSLTAKETAAFRLMLPTLTVG